MAKVLDRYYIPTRYPDSFDFGIPRDYFEEEDAKEAIEYARKILEYAEEVCRESRGE